MPYANNTSFARQMRAYITDKRRRLPKVTVDQYERWFKQFGERLDWMDPKEITLRQLEEFLRFFEKHYSPLDGVVFQSIAFPPIKGVE